MKLAKILNENSPLTRENFLKGAAGAVAAAIVSPLIAKDAKKEENHDHHNMMNMNGGLIASATECVTNGQACLHHCIELVKMKDTSIAQCLDTVQEMLVLCQGLVSMASGNSKNLKAYVAVCRDVCNDCMKECDKHAKEHTECKNCAESCKKCIAECDQLAA